MALKIADRVKETSTTAGTGPLSLAGALTSFRAFSAVMSVGDTCWYGMHAVDTNGNPTGEWEVGIGTYSGANTLTRTRILSSSNAGAAVDFAVGTKHVWIDNPAAIVAEARWFNPPTPTLFSTTYEHGASPGTVTHDPSIGYALDKPNHSGGDSAAFRGKNVPAGAYAATAKIKIGQRGATFDRFGIAVSDGTKFYAIYYDNGDLSSDGSIIVAKITNTTTWGSSPAGKTINWMPAEIFFRIRDDATNLYFDYSFDGLVWNQLHSEARTAYLAATKIGVLRQGYNETGGSGGVLTCVYWDDPDYPAAK